MTLRVVGAGLPRTGTESLSTALAALLDGPCYHLQEIPGHPYDCGPLWAVALADGVPDWDGIFDGYAAAVAWPTSLFWREVAAASPGCLVLLSTRDTAATWLDSMEATVLPVARAVAPQDWIGARDLAVMMERFTGTLDWDDRDVLLEAYDRWIESVREAADPALLVEWQPADGWTPLCAALDVPVPDEAFPWANRRADWVY